MNPMPHRIQFASICLFGVFAAIAWAPARAVEITPALAGFRQVAPRIFEVVTTWQVDEAPPANCEVFVHFCSPKPTSNDDILLGPSTGLPKLEIWKPGTTQTSSVVRVVIPDTAEDGTYLYKVGMYNLGSGNRITLHGEDCGNLRYIIGRIVVKDSGKSISCAGVPTISDARAGGAEISASILDFRQTAPRTASLQLSYNVKAAIPSGYQPFVHVTVLNPDSQHDLITALPPADDVACNLWQVGKPHVTPIISFALPNGTPDGVYIIRHGFYAGSARLQLAGLDDGCLRYTLGKLIVSGGGSKVEFQRQ